MGTDPFDIKWHDSFGGRGYQDIAEEHQRLSSRYGGRGLFTSTAVPIGEEFRVLDFLNRTLMYGSGHFLNRVSRTEANATRVDHIYNVLQGSAPVELKSRLSTNLVTPAKRGERAWGKREAIQPWDIVGPNCMDGAIIGVRGVRAVVLQGASPERPEGELRWPIESAPADMPPGTRRFTLPHFYHKGQAEAGPAFIAFYPDASVTALDTNEEGAVLSRLATTHRNDPHRALLRIAAALGHYQNKILGGTMDENAAKAEFGQYIGDSVTLVREYLAAGANNPAMRVALGQLAAQGFIDSI